MNFQNLYILLGILEYIVQFEDVNSISDSGNLKALDNSLKMWKNHELICGFPPTNLPWDTFYNTVNNSQNATGNAWEINTVNTSDSLETEDYPEDDDDNERQIIINHENFECCQQNIVMNIRNPAQRQRCLTSFFQCVTKTETEKCSSDWMNLIFHEKKFILVVIFKLVNIYVTINFPQL